MNFIDRLKWLPWIPLFQVAGLTTLILLAIEYLLVMVLAQVLPLGSILMGLYGSPFAPIVVFAVAFGVGALAVYLLERLFKQRLSINTAVLWALVPCLVVCLLLRLQLPLSSLLAGLGGVQLMGLIVGIFQKGRRYWHW